MGENSSHTCPACKTAAPRYWPGQGFSFDFIPGAVPGNSGVAKHDHPTADQAVGMNADKRWGLYRERKKVKDAVRTEGATHKLVRRHIKDGSIEYQAMVPQEAVARASLAREAVAKLKEAPKPAKSRR